jgi:inner membrane protein
MDKSPFVDFEYTSRNEHLISPKEDDHTIDVLKWFSNGYYNITTNETNGLQINDLRFGTFQTDDLEDQTYIFSFPLEKKEDGYYELSNTQSGPPQESREAMLKTLWARIKGQ